MPSSRVAVASSPLDEHDAMSPAPTRVTVLPPVTVMAAVPLCPSLVAVIVAGPAAKAVTRPLLLTVATDVLELVQVTVRPVRMLPPASRSVAVSWSVCPAGTLAVAGLTVTEATGALATETAAVCVMAVPLIVAETVFVPATVELKVPVATPVASVGPAGCATVFPLPVAASTAVAPPIGLPLASLAVTVMVDVPLPVAIDGGAAVTVDCAADTGPGVTVTVAVCVTAVPSAVAETVLVPAPVELRVPVATPVASVVPLGCVRVLPLPVVASTTVAPLIALPPASFTVTVMVVLPFPAVIEVGAAATVDCEADTGAAVTVDCAADTGPGATVTVAVCVIAVPPALAETVLVPAPVELRVPVASPAASVVPLGCVSVLPLPAAASSTVAPLIGLPPASFTVTVTVALPLPAVSEVGAAATVDCEADTGAEVTATAAVCVIAVPLTVAETVFGSATVVLSVPVATPVASVVPLGCVRVFPVPVAARTTVAPLIGLPPASFTVTVMVELPLPAVSDAGAAATVDCEADTAPAVTVTPALPFFPSLVAVMVAGPGATPVTRPVALTVAVEVLELVHVTVRPVRMLPLASLSVAVSCTVWPTWTGAAAGVTSTVATGGPPDAGSWQEPLPASVNTLPPDRMNCQAYPSVLKVSLSTP